MRSEAIALSLVVRCSPRSAGFDVPPPPMSAAGQLADQQTASAAEKPFREPVSGGDFAGAGGRRAGG